MFTDDLLLHCAILSKPSSTSAHLINYLIRTFPSSLEKKSQFGYTPLHLAFSLRCVAAAKDLLAAGADPTTRDHRGNNILHTLLCPIYGNNRFQSDDQDIREMMELLDPELLATLSTQRSADEPGSATPLARWMKKATSEYRCYHIGSEKAAAVLRILLAASATGEELELIDSVGDTPLHTVVRMTEAPLLDLMLDKRPDLLYRENATGRTPAEMAQDAWVAEVVSRVPKLKGHNQTTYYYWEEHKVMALVDKSLESFVAEVDERTEKRKVWDVCRKWMGKERTPERRGLKARKRKLVSLFEANEVAKRVAARQGSRGRYGARALFGKEALQYRNGEVKEDEEIRDEVTAWYSSAAQWGEYQEKEEKSE